MENEDRIMSFACTNVERYQHKEGAMISVFQFMVLNRLNYCRACRAVLDAKWEEIAGDAQ